MSAALAQFHFLHPLWLLALLPLPLVAWWLDRRLRGDAAFSRLVDAALLPLLLAPGRRGRRLPLGLLAGCWLVATLAFAGPTWERLPQPLVAQGGARVIALSLSDAMLARDLKPDRLTRARYKIRDLLAASGDTRNALVGYAGDAFVVAPLTGDAETITNLLSSLDPSVMPVGGDATGRAIDLGVKLLQQAGLKGGDILLVASSAGDQAVAAARRALRAGVHVSVLAVGSAAGAPVGVPGGGLRKDASGNVVIAHLEAQRLQQVAAAGGGRYQPLRTDGADVAALREHHRTRGGADNRRATAPRWRDRGPWLLLLLLPLAALVFRRGWLLVLPLALLVLPAPARAAPIPDLWHNADQQAAAALAQGNAKHAAEVAADPAWRGAAEFRAGNYAAAARSYAKLKGADARYNQGNALAAQGKYREAIAAYERALKLDPTLKDAAANRKAIEDWLKRQQQKQQQEQQQNQQGKQQNGKPGAQQDQGQPQSGAGDKGKAQSQPSQSKPGAAQDQPKPQPGQGEGAPKQGRQGQPDAADQRQARQPARSASSPSPAASSEAAAPTPAPASSAAQRQARQAMKRRMDQALAKAPQQPVHVLGEVPAGAASQGLPPELDHALQRVPDDPGGLLRRKFLLEYRHRLQQSNGTPP
ncbi:MAG TPA: tetratricopeptide repeat protein [Rhodanobacteraceae bacterium]|nr:tetratricopeptide repeat protein [Rhodanobacteraceae bacterium]